MEHELRTYPRVNETYLAAVRGEAGWWYPGRTIDLSLTGLALEIEAEIPRGLLLPGCPVAVALSMHGSLVELHGDLIRAGEATGELAIALLATSRPYWNMLSLTFAGLAPAGERGAKPGA